MRTSGPSPFTLNIRVSSQSSRVILTKSIDTTDRNCRRSRIDSDNTCHRGHLGDTTRSRQRNNNRIVVVRHVVVGGVNILTEDSISSTRDQNTISVPSVDSLTRSTVCIVSSSNSNLSTVTNSINMDTIHSNIRDNRDRIDDDFNLVVSPAHRVGLTNHHTKSGGLIQVSRVGGSGSTRNVVAISLSMSLIHIIVIRVVRNRGSHIVVSDFIPLIDDIFSIVIIQISSQSDLTISTNLSLGSSDIHNRLRVNIDEEFLRMCSTTGGNTFALYFNSESVRLSTSIEVLSVEAVVAKIVCHVVSDLTGFIPSVVQIANTMTDRINISDQEHRISLTNVLITRDDNSRVRVNSNSSRRNRQRGTTSLRAGNHCSVDVLLCVIVNRTRSVIDGGGSSTRHQDTVAVPSVNLTLDVAVLRSSRDGDLSTVANSGLGRNNRSDNRIRIDNHRNHIRSSLTERSELENLNMIVVRTKSRNNRVAQFGSTRDAVFTIEPLEGEHISIPIIQRSCESDLTTDADGIFSNRDVHNRSSIHINLSSAGSGASILVHNLNGEAVRIISIRFREGISVLSSGINNNVVF